MPEILGPTIELPPWSHNSSLLFVYLHRRALESPTVTEHLHAWIDLVWGFPRLPPRVGSPHALFISPHPHRVWHSWRRAPLSRTFVCQLPSASLLFGFVRYRDLFAYDVTYVERSGDIVSLGVNLMGADGDRRALPGPVGVDVGDDGLIFRSRAPVAQFADLGPVKPSGFAVFGDAIAVTDGRTLAIVDWSSGERLDEKSGIICVAADQAWFVAADDTGVLNVFFNGLIGNPTFRIPLFGDRVTCCAVSAAFGLVATGTRDGFLVLGELDGGATTHVIDLGGRRPYGLLITNAWGFVAVCATRLDGGRVEHTVAVYTVNGRFVRRAQLREAVAAWTTWSSAADFDFLLVASEQGQLSFCEAFWLEFTEIKCVKLESRVVCLRYQPKEIGVVVVEANGRMLTVPLETDA